MTKRYWNTIRWLVDGYIDKENEEGGSVLFNDALNTFYLRLYGVKHMVKGPLK